MEISDTLLWKPAVKGRPRFRILPGGKIVTYTPSKTVQAQQGLAEQWHHDPFVGPIAVQIALSNAEVGVHIVECDDYTNRSLRGDVDNYCKLVLDALNGVAFEDDSQIVSLYAWKE